MENTTNYDVIIIGGSYSGLSSAMALGRSLRQVLIIDEEKPCNKQTPHSHNFLTNDGRTPQDISTRARAEVKQYDTIHFYKGFANKGEKTNTGFEITTRSGEAFTSSKLIFATGVKDLLPAIPGFSECWGISVIHCPYCHGYEVKHQTTGIFGNGEYGFEFSKMISNWTKDLTLFTNGLSTLTEDQTQLLSHHGIKIVDKLIHHLAHENGYLNQVVFNDGSTQRLKALYAKTPFSHYTDIPEVLGCQLTEQGYIEVDNFQKTTIDGVFACGDNTTFMRSVANAVYAGNVAGAVLNKEMIEEAFTKRAII